MRTNYGKIVVVAVAAVILFTGALPCIAAEEVNWGEERPHRGGGGRAPTRPRMELTEKRIEHIMKRLEMADPEKAKELAELREKDPEEFKAELRKIMRERLGKRQMEQKERMFMRSGRHGPGIGPERHGGTGPGHGGYGRGPEALLMQKRHGEYLEWLQKHYPDEAKELAELKGKKPEFYRRRCGLGLRKHGRIMEASRRNPELAKVLKQDLKLKHQRDRLLGKIKAAGDEDEKKQLVNELEGIIGNRFDLLVKRKEIEYEQMLKKLEDLKKQIEKSKASVEKWKAAEFKKESLKERVGKLVNHATEFKWE